MRFENLGRAPKVVSQGGNTVITLGGSKVTLIGVSAAKFTPNDVIV